MNLRNDGVFMIMLILTAFSGTDNRTPVFIACVLYWIAYMVTEFLKTRKTEANTEELQKIKNEVQLIKNQLAFKSKL